MTADFPRKLKAARFAAHEMTQGELARRAGITRLHVSALEVGRRAPTLETAARLAVALGVRVEELY